MTEVEEEEEEEAEEEVSEESEAEASEDESPVKTGNKRKRNEKGAPNKKSKLVLSTPIRCEGK